MVSPQRRHLQQVFEGVMGTQCRITMCNPNSKFVLHPAQQSIDYYLKQIYLHSLQFITCQNQRPFWWCIITLESFIFPPIWKNSAVPRFISFTPLCLCLCGFLFFFPLLLGGQLNRHLSYSVTTLGHNTKLFLIWMASEHGKAGVWMDTQHSRLLVTLPITLLHPSNNCK